MRMNWWMATIPPKIAIIIDANMPPQGGGIGQDDVVADDAVVGDVGIGHEQIVVADAGNAASPLGAAIDGNTLAKDIVVADHQPSFLPAVAQVLWRVAKGGERKNLVALANGRPAIDHRMRSDNASRNRW